MKGLPVVAPEKLVQTQQELLLQIANTVVVNKLLFEKHYLGAITRFAAYAHLLPASQSHHHRGAGGLLRHSIEVGLWALQAGDKMLLDIGKTPSQRRELEPRWQLAAFLCGLCHDAGKPATDLTVSSHDRTKVWRPITENLSDWAQKNSIDAYFLDWRAGRSKQHIALSNLIADRIISTESLSWIEEGGTELVVWLMEALNGNPGATNPLYDLVLKADQASVERDLKSMGVAMAGYDLGVPVERHLADIMRRLIKEGIWQINEPGARVWNIGGNIYLVWPAAGDEIARQVKDDGIPGLPRTADGILDMLVERQLAFINEHSESGGRCWKLAPAVLAAKIPDIALAVIRLRDDALISSSPIPQVEGRVFGGEVVDQATGEITIDNETASPIPEAPLPSPVVIQPEPKSTTSSAPPPPAEEAKATIPRPRPPIFPASAADTGTEGSRTPQPRREAGKEQQAKRSMPVVAPQAQDTPTPAKKKKELQAPTLVFDGATGEALKAMAEDLKSGEKAWNETLHVDAQEHALLRWPGAFSGYGLTAKTILEELSAKEWLWIDPMMPLRKVQEVEIDGQAFKVIRLEEEPSQALLYAAGYGVNHDHQTSKRKTHSKPAVEPLEAPAAQQAPDIATGIEPSDALSTQPSALAPETVEPIPTDSEKGDPQRPQNQRSKPALKQSTAQEIAGKASNGTVGAVAQQPQLTNEPAAAPRKKPSAGPTPTAAEVLSALSGHGEDTQNAGWRAVFFQDARTALKKSGFKFDRPLMHALAKNHPDKFKFENGKFSYLEA